MDRKNKFAVEFMFRLVKTNESIIINNSKAPQVCFNVPQHRYDNLHLSNHINQWYIILPLLNQTTSGSNNRKKEEGIPVLGNNIPELRSHNSDRGLNIPDLWRDIPDLRCIISLLRSHIPDLRSHILVLLGIFRTPGCIFRFCIGIFQTCEAIFRFCEGEFGIREAYSGINYGRFHLKVF